MSRLPFDVRALTDGDGSVIASLLKRAFESARHHRGAEILESMVGEIDGQRTQGLVATFHGDPRGIVLWTVEESVLTIEVLYVESNSRNLGLGERLVNGAIDHARSIGTRRVLGRALPGDRETKNVFERTGLVSQVIIVGKNLD